MNPIYNIPVVLLKYSYSVLTETDRCFMHTLWFAVIVLFNILSQYITVLSRDGNTLQL